jgi:hypothetical protein
MHEKDTAGDSAPNAWNLLTSLTLRQAHWPHFLNRSPNAIFPSVVSTTAVMLPTLYYDVFLTDCILNPGPHPGSDITFQALKGVEQFSTCAQKRSCVPAEIFQKNLVSLIHKKYAQNRRDGSGSNCFSWRVLPMLPAPFQNLVFPGLSQTQTSSESTPGSPDFAM